MDSWYDEYFVQNWYGNTFLVRRPSQIAREVNGNRDWNTIADYGCHFTCLAMIIGMDPARLASILAKQRYFYANSAIPAVTLAGKRGGIISDGNVPYHKNQRLRLDCFWHSRSASRRSVTIRLIRIVKTHVHTDAKALITHAREKGLHIVCGPEEHSCLVAGRRKRDYYLWDPDAKDTAIEETMRGRYNLKTMFKQNKPQPIEFWLYQVAFK